MQHKESTVGSVKVIGWMENPTNRTYKRILLDNGLEFLAGNEALPPIGSEVTLEAHWYMRN